MRSSLRIDAKGFAYKSILGSYVCLWEDVESIATVTIGDIVGVGIKFKSATANRRIFTFLGMKGLDYDRILPAVVGLTPDALAELLNKRRQNAVDAT